MLFTSRGRSVPFFALAGPLAIIWILAGSVVFGALRAGYDASHAISELGAQGSQNAAVWNVVGFGGTAVLYALYAVAIAAEFGRGWLYRLTLVQVVAIAGGGLFSCDPGCPPAMTSWQGWGHTVAGLSYFAVTCVLPLVAWRVFRSRGEWRSVAPISLVAGIVLVGLFLVGPFLFGAELVGFWQRITLVLVGAWTAVVALRWSRLQRDNVPTVVPA
ncbi:MAG: DUF998 domain-containing protein [Chloroflexota bacterium]|nr:DUF998 domain-containing protein [Chloroflexota bacterium]